MQKKKNYNLNSGIKFQTYNSMKEQLEQENTALLRERENLQHRTAPNKPIPSQYTIIQQSGLSQDYQDYQLKVTTPIHPPHNAGEKFNTIYHKIEQVIDLCSEGQKNNPNENFKQIAQAEKQILGFLNEFNRSPSFNNPNSQTKAYSHRRSPTKINKQSIRQQILQKSFHINVGDELMSMIQQVERKALMEIDNLRSDKISLMKKLNEEMKAHNLEKKKRTVLEQKANLLTNELKKYTQRVSVPQFSTIYEEQQQQKPISFQDNLQVPLDNPYSHTTPNLNKKNPQKMVNNHLNRQYIPAQNLMSQDQPPIIREVHSQIQIENQINRLKQENTQMRNTITTHKSRINHPIKEYLRSQLKNLSSKARQYEQIIANNRQSNANIRGIDPFEIQNLLLRGANIASEGQRLMRVKSKPELREIRRTYDYENQENINELSGIRKLPTRICLQYEGTIKRGERDELNYGNQYQSDKYERIIDQMKRATNL